jgi:hypothetical protein
MVWGREKHEQQRNILMVIKRVKNKYVVQHGLEDVFEASSIDECRQYMRENGYFDLRKSYSKGDMSLFGNYSGKLLKEIRQDLTKTLTISKLKLSANPHLGKNFEFNGEFVVLPEKTLVINN